MAPSWTSPSGSRWEPAPTHTPPTRATPTSTSLVDAYAPDDEAGPARRTRRGPVLVALIALLSLGAVGAGVTYERAQDEPTTLGLAHGAVAPGEPGTGDHAPGTTRGDHRRGDTGTSDGPGEPGTGGTR